MKITIKLRSNVNKSGLQELRIRINSGRDFRKDYDTKLFVDARYWQPQQLKVSNKHSNFIDINRRIKEFKDRIYEANNKFNIGMFEIQRLIPHSLFNATCSSNSHLSGLVFRLLINSANSFCFGFIACYVVY